MMLAGRAVIIGPDDVESWELKSWHDFGRSRRNAVAGCFRTFSENAGSGLPGLADFTRGCTRLQIKSFRGNEGGGSGYAESWVCGLSPAVAVASAPLRL